MGIDDAERCRLGAQVHEDAHQHDMLDDVGEIAGMEGVAIVHARQVTCWSQVVKILGLPLSAQ